MTKRAAVTQSQISRAIRAAQKAGLRVKGISNDGTVIVDSETEAPIIEKATEWSDDQ